MISLSATAKFRQCRVLGVTSAEGSARASPVGDVSVKGASVCVCSGLFEEGDSTVSEPSEVASSFCGEGLQGTSTRSFTASSAAATQRSVNYIYVNA